MKAKKSKELNRTIEQKRKRHQMYTNTQRRVLQTKSAREGSHVIDSNPPPIATSAYPAFTAAAAFAMACF